MDRRWPCAVPLSAGLHLLAAAIVLVTGSTSRALPEPIPAPRTVPLWPERPHPASPQVGSRSGPRRRGVATSPGRLAPSLVTPPDAGPADVHDDGQPPPIGAPCDADCAWGGAAGPAQGPGGGAGDGSSGTGPPISGLTPPRKLRHVDPIYPELARRAAVEGTVRLECVIGPEGRVVDIRVLEGHPLLAKAARDAVQQWMYTPTLLNGQAVSVVLTVTVQFRLKR